MSHYARPNYYALASVMARRVHYSFDPDTLKDKIDDLRARRRQKAQDARVSQEIHSTFTDTRSWEDFRRPKRAYRWPWLY